MAALGILAFFIFLAVAIVQIYIGFLGIDYHLGAFWAWSSIFIAFGFRISLPLTIGTYFGAADVLGWPWYGALALALPGLLFIVPALITSAISTVFDR